MNNAACTTEAKICTETFNASAFSNPLTAENDNNIIRRIIMVGGVLSGFRKQDGGFYLEDDGLDGGYRLSYADTDYLLHTMQELHSLGYRFPERPQVRISNLAYNGSIFDQVRNGETADCLVLANLYWNPDRKGTACPRKDQDSRNFDGQKWREVFDESGSGVLAVIHSQAQYSNVWSRNVPDMITEEAGLKMVQKSRLTRRSLVSGKALELESGFFIR